MSVTISYFKKILLSSLAAKRQIHGHQDPEIIIRTNDMVRLCGWGADLMMWSQSYNPAQTQRPAPVREGSWRDWILEGNREKSVGVVLRRPSGFQKGALVASSTYFSWNKSWRFHPETQILQPKCKLAINSRALGKCAEIIPGQQKGFVEEWKMSSTFIPSLFSVLPNARKRGKDSRRGKAGYSKLREIHLL